MFIMGSASSSCASVVDPPSDATYSPSLSGYDSSTSDDDSQVAPDLDLAADFTADARAEVDPITLSDMLIGLEMNHTVDFDGCARPRLSRRDRRRNPTPYDYVQYGLGSRAHPQRPDDKADSAEDKQLSVEDDDLLGPPDFERLVSDMTELNLDHSLSSLTTGDHPLLSAFQQADTGDGSPGSEDAAHRRHTYSSVLHRCVDGLDKYRSPLSAHMDQLTKKYNVFDPNEREQMRKAMLEFTPPDGQTWTAEQWSSAIAQEVEYFKALIGQATSRTQEMSEHVMSAIQDAARTPQAGPSHHVPSMSRAPALCPVHSIPDIDPNLKPQSRKKKKKVKQEPAVQNLNFESDPRWSFPLPGLPIPIIGTFDETGSTDAGVTNEAIEMPEAVRPKSHQLPKGVPVIPPESPLIPPEAPPDPLALLVEAPWSIGEVLLLLDVVSHFPPSIFGWARIADAYNYALMERSLQEWFAATGTEVDAEDAWMLKAEQRYIARQFQRMHADRTRDASQKAAAEPAIPPTYADVLRRRLQPQPKEQQQPQQGQPQQQGRPHPFCLKVAHRPPLTFPSDLAYVYEAIAEYRAKQQTSANAAGSNEQLADLLRVLYMELNPHFPLRSPWECWHRWCVPYVPSSSDEQKAKMRGEGVSLKDLKDKALKRADQRPPPSPVSPSPVSPSEASSSASPTVSVSHPPTASSSDASPVSPSETRRPKIHPILGNLLAPDVVPPPGTYSDAPGVKRDADSKYDPTGVMKVFTLTTVCDAEPFKAEHGALRSNRIVSEASQLLKGVQEPLTHKPKKGRKVARGKKAEKKQHPNVPVGTFGSHERPGIRTWFENAAVNRAALGRVFGEGSDGPWRKMDTAIAELGPKENAASDSRTQDEQPTDDDDSGGPWLPVHLKKMRVPPAPEWRQARYGSKADSRKRSKD